MLDGGNLADSSIESVLEDREPDSKSIDAGLDDCKSDSALVDESINSVLDGSELDSVLKRKLVLVERSIDSVNDSVFDDRSICTGLDDSKIGVFPDTSDDLVLDGSKFDSG